MVHVDTAASDDSFEERGFIDGRAYCGVRFALSEGWRGTTFVGGGVTPKVLQRKDRWGQMRTRRMFAVTERMPVG